MNRTHRSLTFAACGLFAAAGAVGFTGPSLHAQGMQSTGNQAATSDQNSQTSDHNSQSSDQNSRMTGQESGQNGEMNQQGNQQKNGWRKNRGHKHKMLSADAKQKLMDMADQITSDPQKMKDVKQELEQGLVMQKMARELSKDRKFRQTLKKSDAKKMMKSVKSDMQDKQKMQQIKQQITSNDKMMQAVLIMAHAQAAHHGMRGHRGMKDHKKWNHKKWNHKKGRGMNEDKENGMHNKSDHGSMNHNGNDSDSDSDDNAMNNGG